MHDNPPDLPKFDKEAYEEPMDLIEVPTGMVYSTIRTNCAPFDVDIYGTGHHVLYLTPEAYPEFVEYVKYGKKRACNVHEQQFVGMGHNFLETNGSIQTVVTKILPIYSASRGPTHAKIVSEGNDAMLDILENERKIQNQLEKKYNTDEKGYAIDPFLKHGPSKVVAFGHTHPGIDCEFSSVDYRSNYSTPTSPIVSFVCDPLRKDMRAMVGIGYEPMKIVVCRPKSVEPARTSAIRGNAVLDLLQRVGIISNQLLQQAGISGKYDCYHDRQGRTHVQLRIVHQPSGKQHKR